MTDPLEARLGWHGRAVATPDLRVALLASYTIAPLEAHLGMALVAEGFAPCFHLGAHEAIALECLDPESGTAAFAPDVLLVHARLEELWPACPIGADDDPAADALALAEQAIEAAGRWAATLIWVLPATPSLRPLGAGDASHPAGVGASAARVREALRDRLVGRPGVVLVDAEEAMRDLGERAAYAPALWATARIPYSEAYFHALGGLAGRAVALARRPARRVIVVDADDTLWAGTIGEDGPDGVRVGAAQRAFQDYMLELRRAGFLLALCSKNEEADVLAAMGREEMRLRLEHLSAWRIGWEPKPEALRALATELGFGLDAMVFLDDHPAERAEVAMTLPEVAVVALPQDPAAWPAAVQRSGHVDRLPPTAEDLARADRHCQERARRQAAAGVDREAFLAGLGLALRLVAPGPGELARLAQLVSKTHQFNLTGRRRSEAALAAVLADSGFAVRLAAVSDRFGDYGLVGAFILHWTPEGAELDTFLLSCRVLGRGVEAALLAAAMALAAEHGHAEVLATPTALPRNGPARALFAGLGAGAPGRRAPLARCPWPEHVARG